MVGPMRSLLIPSIVAFASIAGCGDKNPPPLDPRYETPGAFAVGNTTISALDSARSRELTMEVWFPLRGSSMGGGAVEDFVADLADRQSYMQLLDEAPADCPSKQTGSDREALVDADGVFPLVVFSHCHNCTRFSSFAIAERLASHGFVVAAPDHAGNTLFDDLAGTGVELDSAFLQVRAADISFVIDTMLSDSANLDITIDPSRIGVYGHSFGAVTTGLVLQDDPRPVAGFAIASPMENPLLEGVEMDSITDPVGFLIAVEDNSITEIGNLFIRQNFDEASVPAWKGEVVDAGHWSFSDICGLDEQFAACCGQDDRQTDDTPFTYLPVASGIAIAQAYVTAFFDAHVNGDANGARYLEASRFEGGIAIETRP